MNLQMIIRVLGLLLLVLGLLFWTGKAFSLIQAHVWLGYVMTLVLFILIFQAFRAGISIGFVILAAIVGAALPVWGLNQGSVFQASLHWLGQVLHVLIGIIAIGLAEMLGARIRKKNANTEI